MDKKSNFEEGSKIMKINNIFSSEDDNYTYAPDIEKLSYSKNASYVHYCPNETIQGNAIP